MTKLGKYLSGVKARADAATPGPWSLERVDHDSEITFEISAGKGFFAKMYESDFDNYARNLKGSCQFIASSRADVPKLLAMVELMRDALEFECDGTCARGINPCNARETLDKLEELVSE